MVKRGRTRGVGAAAQRAADAQGRRVARWRSRDQNVQRFLPLIPLGVAVVLVGLQPIDAVDLWWQLARGRVVADGHWAPSRVLLEQESLADADWLGGLPWYLIHSLIGLGGLALLRPLSALLAGWIAWRVLDGPPWWRGVMAGGFLLVVSPALDPAALWLDLWWLLAVGLVVAGSRGEFRPLTAGAVLLLLLLWANSAPRVVVGLAALAIWVTDHSDWQRGRASRGVLMLIGGLLASLLTPRAAAGLVDSFTLTFPGWTATGPWLDEGPWAWGLEAYSTSQLLGFLALSVVALLGVIRPRSGVGALAGLCLAQLVAWHNVGNMALGGGLLLFALQRRGQQVAGAGDSGGEGTSARWSAAPGAGGKLATGLRLAVVGLVAAGLGRQATGGVGFGLAERLDVRFVQRALASTSLNGTALADGMLTAGMLAWAGADLQVQEAPHRALLGARLRQHRLLLDDLRQGRRAAYQRSDDSRGGWWLPLMQRDTVLLLVEATDTAMLSGLQPTLWRPLALDGPVIPLGRAGEPQLVEPILQAMRLQDLVEFGPWGYQPPSSSGSLFDRDWFGLRPMVDEPSIALRQAAVMRALGLPRAALRVLSHLQRSGRDRQAEPLVRRCHGDLVDWEVRIAGRSSAFRQRVLAMLAGAAEAPAASPLERAALAYAGGDAARALQWLADAGDSVELRYARASLLLEAGQLEAAHRQLRSLADQVPSEATGLWAADLVRMLPVED